MCTPNQLILNETMNLGTNSTSASMAWTQQGRECQSNQGLIQPQPMDVLCGKSKVGSPRFRLGCDKIIILTDGALPILQLCVDHGGSRRFRTVIECYREQYQQALTKVRNELSTTLVW